MSKRKFDEIEADMRRRMAVPDPADPGRDSRIIGHGTPANKWLQSNLDRVKRKIDSRKRDLQLVPLTQIIAQDPRTRTFLAGDVYDKRAVDFFHKLGYHSAMQRETFDDIHAAFKPHVYGEDYDRCRTKLLDAHGDDRFPSAVILIAPRQFGKSVVVSHAFAVHLLNMRRKKGIILSNRLRSGEELLAKIAAL